MQASKDENSISTLIATLRTDGKIPIRILASPVTHRLMGSFGTSGSDLGPTNALKDDNDVSSLLGTSEDDGITPIPVYSTLDGRLLLKST